MLLDELVKPDKAEVKEWKKFFKNAPYGIIEKIRQEANVSRPTINKLLNGDTVKEETLLRFRNWMTENAIKYIAA